MPAHAFRSKIKVPGLANGWHAAGSPGILVSWSRHCRRLASPNRAEYAWFIGWPARPVGHGQVTVAWRGTVFGHCVVMHITSGLHGTTVGAVWCIIGVASSALAICPSSASLLISCLSLSVCAPGALRLVMPSSRVTTVNESRTHTEHRSPPLNNHLVAESSRPWSSLVGSRRSNN